MQNQHDLIQTIEKTPIEFSMGEMAQDMYVTPSMEQDMAQNEINKQEIINKEFDEMQMFQQNGNTNKNEANDIGGINTIPSSMKSMKSMIMKPIQSFTENFEQPHTIDNDINWLMVGTVTFITVALLVFGTN